MLCVVMGIEIEVSVRVRCFPVDGDRNRTICLSGGFCVQEGYGSICLGFHRELNVGVDGVEV